MSSAPRKRSPHPSPRPVRVAVVGSGPAGIFTVQALLRHHEGPILIDLIERLPVPYGLVRYGVAPDHQKTKSVTRSYDRTLADPRVRFLGNVHAFGKDLDFAELRAHYDQVAIAVGCRTDRRLGIPGEDLAGSHAATSFVAWYNGHPDFRDYEVDLQTERAVVVGAGDVALDICRLLVKPFEELAATDMADAALEVFRRSRIREVELLVRRGPAQAAFAVKELRELVDLAKVDVVTDPELARAALEDPALYEGEVLDASDRQKLELLASLPAAPRASARRCVRLRFLRSPVEVLGERGRVSALRVEENRLVERDGRLSAAGTGVVETIPAGLLVRSVGYRGFPLPGVPFDERRGVFPNLGGRVTQGPGGPPLPGVYVSGWIKRGPIGVIGTNKTDAADTVASMLEDLRGRPLPDSPERNPASVDDLLARRGVRVVTFDDWRRIDARELELGAARGKTRQKLATVEEMVAALDEAPATLPHRARRG